jgi:hypothetical protein
MVGFENLWIAGEPGRNRTYNKHLKIALDLVAEAGHRLLLALDGCDPVLQTPNLTTPLRITLRIPTDVRGRHLLVCDAWSIARRCG